MTTSTKIGYGLIAIAILIVAVVGVTNVTGGDRPIVFSEKSMLDSLWREYKSEYIEEGTGRALDRQQNDITTSEGQSYTLLRAVWMDDKATFDQAYTWTKDNLGRPDDKLASWLYGKRADGTYGVLSDRGGNNTATDADTDIAVALLFAHGRWGEDYYLDDAKAIIEDVWEKDIVMIDGVPYLAANDLERLTSNRPIINPSYFSPYAYRMFAEVDPDHDWMAVVDSSYDILMKTSSSTLGMATSSGLPPDWVVLERGNGEPVKTDIQGLTSNYGYDAFRTPWRIALDHVWYDEPRAKEYLDRLGFLSQEWRAKGMLAAVYSHDGSVVQASEAPAAYGGAIGYFMVSDPELAKEVYEKKLAFLFDQDTNTWKGDLSYYDSNWAWFGIALYNGLLPNLADL